MYNLDCGTSVPGLALREMAVRRTAVRWTVQAFYHRTLLPSLGSNTQYTAEIDSWKQGTADFITSSHEISASVKLKGDEDLDEDLGRVRLRRGA